jgi:hypothetical protein
MESDALLFAQEEFADATVLGFDYLIAFFWLGRAGSNGWIYFELESMAGLA